MKARIDDRNLAEFEGARNLGSQVHALIRAIHGASVDIVQGIDLNRFRRYDVQDPKAIYNSGRRFVIFEATWGLWVPPSFAEFWPRFLDAGFLLMAYGFFCGDQDGAGQAELLLETVAPMFEAQGFWMPLGGDVEAFKGDTSTPSIRIPRWHGWMDTIRTQVRPMAYSNVPSWQKLMQNDPLPDDVIGWAAHYNATTSPNMPGGWKRENSPFHQYGIATLYPWCPAVPGMASVVDVDRVYLTYEQLRALGSDSEPPVEEPPMSELTDKIQEAQGLADDLSAALAEALALAQTETPPVEPPPPPPPPATTITIRCTDAPYTLARYYTRKNDAGYPVFIIYPSDTSPTSDRIRFPAGTLLPAFPNVVRGDSGVYCYELTEHKGRAGETLFIRTSDAVRV